MYISFPIGLQADRALMASYKIADLLAKKAKPFSDGAFLKECMLIAAGEVCPDAMTHLEGISLSASVITERTVDIAADIESQLRRACSKFVYFSIAMDESTDNSDVAQLAVFVRGIDEDLLETEELLDLVPMQGQTRGLELFNALAEVVERYGLSWTK